MSSGSATIVPSCCTPATARYLRSMQFADLELSRRLERTEATASTRFVEARARVSPASGATWIEVVGAYAMYDGPDSPISQTFGLGLFQDPGDADFDMIERFFRERGAPVFHEVSPLAGLAVAAQLSERGYRPVEFTSVMYRPIGPGSEPLAQPNPAITVRPIRSDEGPVWADLTVRGWTTEHPELADYLRDLSAVSTERQDTVSVLAELDGAPVGSAALCLHGGVALLAGACTVPEARRRGAQLSLLHYRLSWAVGQGADLAMMGALPGSPSQHNAERHGFRVAYTRIKWGRASSSNQAVG